MLIAADDLTGATDCAVAFAAHGLKTFVVLDGDYNPGPADVLAVDADTRGLTRDEAAAKTLEVVQRGGAALYKKLDSTLRGHVGAELAAALSAWRGFHHSAFVIFAPAFPAMGRTTAGGRQLLHGVPLEVDIRRMLHAAHLRYAFIDLQSVRRGAAWLESAPAASDVLVCDAESDLDLAAIAQAARPLGPAVVWAGSAGLAHQLPQCLGMAKKVHGHQTLPVAAAPLIFVIGSPSSVSQEQAALLAREKLVSLVYGSATGEAFAAALTRGDDVLVRADPGAPVDPGTLCRQLARFVAPHVTNAGGLVLSGGETARAVLLALGIPGLRLISEVEPGVPLSLALGGGPPLPVITKAGAFGRPDTLLRCMAVMKGKAKQC